MATDFLERSDVIEECYEFLLGYAAQGLPTDKGSAAGREVRTRLQQGRKALVGLEESFRRAVMEQQFDRCPLRWILFHVRARCPEFAGMH
jgi:hypothetical protein